MYVAGVKKKIESVVLIQSTIFFIAGSLVLNFSINCSYVKVVRQQPDGNQGEGRVLPGYEIFSRTDSFVADVGIVFN